MRRPRFEFGTGSASATVGLFFFRNQAFGIADQSDGIVHGSLQSGRPCQTDPTSALHTTRHFAEAKCLPTDPRRAATLEGYAISRTPVDALSTSKIRLSNLSRMADDFDRWEQYWPSVLEHAQRNGDSLAYTALTTFQFVTLSTMSTVFTRWANERKKSLDEGGSGRPVLSTGDWSALQRAADACQKMIFSVSVEATQGGSSIRAGMWPGSPHQAYRMFSLWGSCSAAHTQPLARRGTVDDRPQGRARLHYRTGHGDLCRICEPSCLLSKRCQIGRAHV